MSRPLLFVVLVGIVVVTSAANRAPSRGDEDNYWKTRSLILASIARSGLSRDESELVLRPIGTVSGNLDVSKSPEMTVRLHLRDVGIDITPQRGELLLALIVSSDRVDVGEPRSKTIGVAKFIRMEGALYMPLPGAPIARISDLSDDKFGDTLSAIQKLRRTPDLRTGRGTKYWSEHSLICGAVQNFLPPEAGRMPVARVLLRPFATLSGSFDAGNIPTISVEWNSAMRDESRGRRPIGGEKVLVVLQRTDRVLLGWDSPDGRSAYMPGTHESFRVVKSFSDPEVEATLKAVQSLRMGERR